MSKKLEKNNNININNDNDDDTLNDIPNISYRIKPIIINKTYVFKTTVFNAVKKLKKQKYQHKKYKSLF
jgi:hypothetical protein